METQLKLGWIGTGRMGFPMAERLLRLGDRLLVWNRTRSRAEPLAEQGARIVARASDLSHVDILFCMVSTGRDLEDVLFGADGVAGGGRAPRIVVDFSSIGVDESAQMRRRLEEAGSALVAAPVSGNNDCVRAGKLSIVTSGPRGAVDDAEPFLKAIAGNGVSYVGEGELSRICKIAHNVMLGVVTQNLAEITLLAQKAGVPRHAFLDFINNSVMGSVFTRYKSPAIVNCDWTTTFTPELLRKDLDLGLSAGRSHGVAMPTTAVAREMLQAHFGAASRQPDPEAYLQRDFAALFETMAMLAGVTLESEERTVASGLEPQAE